MCTHLALTPIYWTLIQDLETATEWWNPSIFVYELVDFQYCYHLFNSKHVDKILLFWNFLIFCIQFGTLTLSWGECRISYTPPNFSRLCIEKLFSDFETSGVSIFYCSKKIMKIRRELFWLWMISRGWVSLFQVFL